MTQFNDKLRNSLANDSAIDDLRNSVIESFSGRAKWLTIGAWLKTIFFLVAAAVAAVQFFKVESVRALIAWASVFVVMTSSMGVMFVLYWIQLNRNSLMREVKRLELAIARLTSRSE